MADDLSFVPPSRASDVASGARAENRLRHRVDRLLDAIDRLVARQLDAILHHPRFREIEGSWRGLNWLVNTHKSAARVKILILAASWRELDRDLARVVEFDQSSLFRLIYENEFGHAGGEPFGLLLFDHEVRHRPLRRDAGGPAPVDDLSVLSGISAIAAAAFAPAVLGAAPSLFGADDFEDMVLSSGITDTINDEEHARWRAFAAREDTRFVSMVLPRILARPQWRSTRTWPNGVRYGETSHSVRDRPWFSAAYALGCCVIRAFCDHGWPANIRGVTTDRLEGGLVLDLPEDPFRIGAVTRWRRPSLSIGLVEFQERELVMAGFMPLNTLPHGDAVFGSARSLQTERLQAPGRGMSPFLANRRLSAQTSAILAVSRFAHYVKLIGRDLAGSSLTSFDIEQRLQSWLMNYVNSNPGGASGLGVRFPLRSGRVSVREVSGRPEAYGCTIHLQPHHQLDGVSTTFRLVTTFTAPGRTAAAGSGAY